MNSAFYRAYIQNKTPQFLKQLEEFEPLLYLQNVKFYASDIITNHIVLKQDCPYRQQLLEKYLESIASHMHFQLLTFFTSFEEDLKTQVKEIIKNKSAEAKQEYLKKHIIKAIKRHDTHMVAFLLDCELIFSNKIKKEIKQIPKNDTIELLLDRASLEHTVKKEDTVSQSKKILKL